MNATHLQHLIADAMHAFRTPMSIIEQYASLLLENGHERRTEDDCQCLRSIRHSVFDMDMIGRGLGLLADIATHRLRLCRRRYQLPDLADDIQRQLSSEPAARIEVTIDLTGAQDAALFGDCRATAEALLFLAFAACRKLEGTCSFHLKVAHRNSRTIDIELTTPRSDMPASWFEPSVRRPGPWPGLQSRETDEMTLPLRSALELARLNLSAVGLRPHGDDQAAWSVSLPIDEPGSIVAAWINCCAPGLAQATIASAMRIEAMSSAGVEDVADFLDMACDAADLILPAGETAWLVLSARGDDLAWGEILQSQRSKYIIDSGLNTFPALQIATAGQYELPSQRLSLVDLISAVPPEPSAAVA